MTTQNKGNLARGNRGPSAGPENRRALLTAAREVFATDGFSAPLSAIARRAGVGQGSLYRHFPDRTALAIAIFDENIAEIEVFVDKPESTLDDLLDRVIEQALVSTALIDLVMANARDPRAVHLADRLNVVVARLLAREQQAGRIGQHVSTADVILAVSMLAGVLARSEAADRPDVARRAWGLFHAAFTPH
ncbi:helix-turn-helix domain containing protein [Cryobacterium sp. SO2]|uniref:TetR/AcrR family transcriptional regulator n=1 Tax=Cryobacterium sp. SO2 TaxID=1897060 RepID=UPI00223D1E38|nr:TetR/AcrR family transcriptional regulator [Cryobacterium sp. SO2]WEO77359.1 helix-turn-helix domain containing protein [Cryobacterium sp. SO2]